MGVLERWGAFRKSSVAAQTPRRSVAVRAADQRQPPHSRRSACVEDGALGRYTLEGKLHAHTYSTMRQSSHKLGSWHGPWTNRDRI